jgi:hypothetical protein
VKFIDIQYVSAGNEEMAQACGDEIEVQVVDVDVL